MIIGLDVGGTHTDIVLLGHGGVVREIKVPTDHADLFRTVLTGLESVTDGIPPGEIRRAVLSTTLTTNAIVQDKIPPVGMVVSCGPGILPEYSRTNENFKVVSGSIDHRGREIEPVDAAQMERIAADFEERGIRYVGVVSKFSVRNPDHELRMRDRLGNSFEKIFMGHRVSGNLNFPRRVATTFLNAAVYPIHREFFHAVKRSLEKKGLDIPIHILKADGGTMSVDASIEFPGQTILSGPAASIVGAMAFAFENEDTLVLDIGGTTTDIAVLINRAPLMDPVGIQLGRYRTLIRSMETCSIGMGGDSVVRILDGSLRIGPERIGPPMAHGGPAPTPTDALAILGLKKTGDREKSIEGFRPISAALGVSVEETANRVFDGACQTIIDVARAMIDRLNSQPVYTIQEMREGDRIGPRKILVLGGPAHHFARNIEKLSGLEVGVVPRWRVANAIGAALARTTCEVTLFADTERGIAVAPEENYTQSVGRGFSKANAVESAYALLREKALSMGARSDDLEMEVIEDLQFNMVRGFSTTGRNIRIKAQIRPGLISAYDAIAEMLS